MDVRKYLNVILIMQCFDSLRGKEKEHYSNKSLEQVIHIQNQGLVRGRKANDGPYNEYLGIKYATVTRENRFKASLPGPSWQGIRDVNDEKLVCAQLDYNNLSSQTILGIEDCLALNVYTPANIASHIKLPVMVYVHGGQFTFQSCCKKSLFGPKRFMAENVILVNFNYRLNALGFLCYNDTANNGIKDIITALKWVRDHIKSFGGDPRKVTLFGHSSGSTLVEAVMLSKQSKGLISGAIAQSGSALSPWFLTENPEDFAYKIAQQLGYEGRNYSELMSVLKKADVANVVKAHANLTLSDVYLRKKGCPCVEPVTNADAIITNDPLSIINSGDYNDVPYMQGLVQNEGMILYEVLNFNPNYFKLLDNYFNLTLPKDLQFLSAEHNDRIVHLVNQFYFGGKNISEASTVETIQYFGDTQYVLPIIQSIRSLARANRTSPLYLYKFAYDGGMPFLKRILNIMDKPGVCHGDELGYLWTQDGTSAASDDDEITAKRIVKLWTNFAKFGDPTPETNELLPVKWETAEDLKYLLINNTLEIAQYPFKERIEFWDNIYKNLPKILQ